MYDYYTKINSRAARDSRLRAQVKNKIVFAFLSSVVILNVASISHASSVTVRCTTNILK